MNSCFDKIKYFDLFVYIATGILTIVCICILFEMKISNVNSLSRGIILVTISYFIGFVLHYLGIQIYKHIPKTNPIKILLDRDNPHVDNYYVDKCSKIAKDEFGYKGENTSKYSKLVYYKMRYFLAEKCSWENFAEDANSHHYMSLALFALVLFLILSTIIFMAIRLQDWSKYLIFLSFEIIFAGIFLMMAKNYAKIHVLRIINMYFQMHKECQKGCNFI